MNKKILFRWLKLFCLIYGIIGIAFYYGQEKLLFHPIALHVDDRYPFPKPYEEINIAVTEQSNIHIVQFPAQSDSCKGVVLFFHGNKENISHYANYAPIFMQKGYQVWMMEYPSFGKSKGTLTEKNCTDWALQTYKLARKKFIPQQIIIYGKSLGTGVATQLASVRDCKNLILESPYYNLAAVFKPYLFLYPLTRLMHFHFPTNEYIQKVDAPITIFHGTNDWLIPIHNSEQLTSFFTTGDTLIKLDRGGHHGLDSFPEFKSKMAELLK